MSLTQYSGVGNNVVYVSTGFDGGELEPLKRYNNMFDANEFIGIGQTMVICAGTHSMTQREVNGALIDDAGFTFKGGVNYYFMPGATVLFGETTANSQAGKFNCGAGETVNILGHADFISTATQEDEQDYLFTIGDVGRINIEFNSIKCLGDRGAFHLTSLGNVNIKGNYFYGENGCSLYVGDLNSSVLGTNSLLNMEISHIEGKAVIFLLNDIYTSTVPKFVVRNSYIELLSSASSTQPIISNSTTEGSNVSIYTFQNCLLKNSHNDASSHGIDAVEGHFVLLNVGIQTTHSSSECVAGSCNVRSGNCIANESVGASVTQDVGAISVDAQFTI